ncbi:MAG TPA: RHS repeat-associated core domain-containing protein, partial [Thermoanaerobaculia bacterium]|nr:RHS repeat-associated core domain-containing protein [Thermoanaerobaculia bacterium]
IGSAVGQILVDSSSNRLRGETYDAAGNVTTHHGADRFSFDSLNMMDEVEVAFGSTRRMLYGPDEERIGVIHDENLIRWTLRDFDGRVLREYRGDCCAWEWMEDYVYGEGRLLAGQREEFFRGKRHFHTDHLGTIRLITDQNTRSISRHDFSPFGVEQTDPHYERKSSTMADDYRARTDPMKYTAHERELLGWYNYETTDYLDNMHARFYDPNDGRFLSADPVMGLAARPQSWNRYSYVQNDPVNAIDPSGMVEQGLISTFTGEIDVVAAGYLFDAIWTTFQNGTSEINNKVDELSYRWGKGRDLEMVNDRRQKWGEKPFGSWEECYLAHECFTLDDLPMFVGGSVRKTAFNRAARLLGAARYTAQQQALIDLAKRAARTGVTKEEAMQLIKWAREYGIPYQNHMFKVSRAGQPNHWVGGPHIRIGKVNHIKVLD